MVILTRPEKILLLKYALVIYLSYMIAGVIGLPVTTSTAFSAVLVLAFGATWKGTTRYSINRMLVQAIGISVGYIL